MFDPDVRALLERIGRRVRSLRGARGLTARETAGRAGLSPRFYSDLEGGKANIAIGRLAAVARALGVHVEELVTDAEPVGSGRPPRAAVALLGLRGAGKSTLGPRCAEALGLPFVELDELIEGAAGMSLPELFALHGEPYYRRLTQQCLSARLAEEGPAVIALPGGIVQDEEAFGLLRRRCTTVWLKARPEDHMDRVLGQGDERPMAGRRDAMAELRAILATREPLYRQAELSVETSGRELERSADELVRTLASAGWPARVRPPGSGETALAQEPERRAE